MDRSVSAAVSDRDKPGVMQLLTTLYTRAPTGCTVGLLRSGKHTTIRRSQVTLPAGKEEGELPNSVTQVQSHVSVSTHKSTHSYTHKHTRIRLYAYIEKITSRIEKMV